MQVNTISQTIREIDFPRVLAYQGRTYNPKADAFFCSDDYAPDGESLSAQEAAQRFEEIMEQMPKGYYVVSLMKNPQAVNSRKVIKFFKAEGPGEAGQMAAHQLSGISQEAEIERRVNERIDRFEAEWNARQERQALEAKIGELETQLAQKDDWYVKAVSILKLAGVLPKEVSDLVPPNRGMQPDRTFKGPEVGSGSPQMGDASGAAHPQEGDEELIDQHRFETAMEGLVDKAGDNTIPLLERLSHIPADKLAKLALMPEEQIQLLTGAL